MEALGNAVLARAIDFVLDLERRPASSLPDAGATAELVRRFLEAPPEAGRSVAEVLQRLDPAIGAAVETAGPRNLGWIPGGGLFASAVADLYALVVNRYVGLASFAPGLTALEHGVVRWLCELCGLPERAGGLLLSGGSMANFAAVVAARHALLGDDIARGTAYVGAQAHHSMAKALRLAGLPAASIRVVPSTPQLRLDVEAAARMIASDRAGGSQPFLLVGSAGTTDTGTIDPLPEVADLAAAEGLWYHADAAYGGLFRLTQRGRERLAGIERADSITLDPHKSLFLPSGTGALVVRDAASLHAAHSLEGHYLQDVPPVGGLPDFAALGPELTRELRGLRVWLPLQLHGIGAFRAALDEKLDLARLAYDTLAAEPALDVPREPDLTIVTFRPRGAARASGSSASAGAQSLLERVNRSRRVILSSTEIDGQSTLRLAILAHRTHARHVAEALDIITTEARAGDVDARELAAELRRPERHPRR